MRELQESKVTLEDIEKIVQEELKVEKDLDDITEVIRQMRERDYEFEYRRCSGYQRVVVKGILPPLRRKRDDIYRRQSSLHKSAKELLRKAQAGEFTLHEPLIALVETSTVLWGLSKSERIADIGVEFLETYSLFTLTPIFSGMPLE
ncbi:hypothetical protein [Thermococcus sp.]|uniref:hypothetical protein n=1 Tax=Thermococcus sp. TaxID=35749 RepID=UPI002621181D|nr:hypothetical protein [Thermococcus sp.]